MISVSIKGDYKKIDSYFEKVLEAIKFGRLDKYGQRGVDALKEYTPKRTGKTSESWYYEIEHKKGEITISWKNSNRNDGECIAALIQYGHGTRRGHYVEGVDYINPAMKSVFTEISEEAWKEVSTL